MVLSTVEAVAYTDPVRGAGGDKSNGSAEAAPSECVHAALRVRVRVNARVHLTVVREAKAAGVWIFGCRLLRQHSRLWRTLSLWQAVMSAQLTAWHITPPVLLGHVLAPRWIDRIKDPASRLRRFAAH